VSPVVVFAVVSLSLEFKHRHLVERICVMGRNERDSGESNEKHAGKAEPSGFYLHNILY
jgi:hypothetical protein